MPVPVPVLALALAKLASTCQGRFLPVKLNTDWEGRDEFTSQRS